MTAWTSALFAVLVLSIAWPGTVLAESSSPLSAAWETYRHAVEAQPAADIVAAARALPEAARQADALASPELSLVMIRDADVLRERGEIGTAIQIARIASSLSPRLVVPHAWLAQAWLAGPEPDVLAGLKEWAAAWRASISDFWSLLYRIDRLIAAVLMSVVSAAAAVVGFFVVRTIPLLAHLIVEWSGHRVFRPTGWLIAAALVLLPLAMIRWGVWLVLAPCAVAWWFLSSRERLMLGVLAGLGGVASVLLPYVVPALMADHSDELRLIVDTAEGRGMAPSAAAVTVESAQGAAARGTALVRSGQMDEAAMLYQESLVRWPGHARLLTGYGNLLFRRHDYDRAIAQYEQALKSVPDSVPVLYNLSQAYRGALRFEEGEATYQAARALDAGLLDRYAERSRRGETMLVADYPTTHRELLSQAFEARPLPPLLRTGVDRMSRHIAPLATLGILGLFAGCWFIGKWFPNQPASPCVTCGTAVCRYCQRYFLDLKLCPSCWKTHAKGAKFSAQTTLPQVRRRWEVRRRRATLLSVVPGVGHLALGRPLWGLVFGLAGWGLVWTGLLRDVTWNTTELRMSPLPWYTTWAPIALGFSLLVVVGVRHLWASEQSSVKSALPAEPS